jgi:hypothetical protein
LPDGRTVVEATVNRVSNGISVNYTDPYMRRRDPDCLLVADVSPTDKPSYKSRYGKEFGELRQETLTWLSGQDLGLFAFHTGGPDVGQDAVAILPANAAFFALGLGLLQGILPVCSSRLPFSPEVFIVVAPPFRHTHFGGKQIVVHERIGESYWIFSYNLYPGPSAKKGIYGTLIHQGESEGWVTTHCSCVRVTTPYDNSLVIMHEGASGGGKSEMLEQPHRMPDGRLLKGRNVVTGEERFLEIPRTCDLEPVCDDMALCHPRIQQDDGRLWLVDAEKGWFVRVNHIGKYGTDHDLEALTIDPPQGLLFLNINTVPQSTALIWQHTEDRPGVRCPNPRVIIPRSIVPNVVNHEVPVDIRSMGIRTPPCTSKNPSYGIVGLFHILPPALAWLWRLVAPRGFANPSVIDSETLESEGVGSYWPFATGKIVTQANLLLQQFEIAPRVRNILVPNQHIGAWWTGFMPQWLARDYLARKGISGFSPDQIVSARCPLLGYALRTMRIEGINVSEWFLRVETQPEVGEEAYDRGAQQLSDFFTEHLKQYMQPDLSPLGRRIIDCFFDNGTVEDYCDLMPQGHKYLFQRQYGPEAQPQKSLRVIG